MSLKRLHHRIFKAALPIGDFAVFSAIQFALSFVVSAKLAGNELSLVSFATIVGIFTSGLVRAALLSPMITSDLGSNPRGEVSSRTWSYVIVLASALCGAICLSMSAVSFVLGNTHVASQLAVATIVAMTMPVYDMARRGFSRSRKEFVIGLLLFAATVCLSSLIFALCPALQSGLAAIVLIGLGYTVASLSIYRDAWRGTVGRHQWMSVWSLSRASVLSSPVIAVGTGAVMQGIPLMVGTHGGSILGTYYASRVLALPAWNFLNGCDALQRRMLRRDAGKGRLLSSVLTSGGGLLALIGVYTGISTIAFPFIQTHVGGGFAEVPLEAVMAWGLLLACQVLSTSVENGAYASDRSDLIAWGKCAGIGCAGLLLAIWPPQTLPQMLHVMAASLTVGSVLTGLAIVSAGNGAAR